MMRKHAIALLVLSIGSHGLRMSEETKPDELNNEGRKKVNYHSVNDIVSAGERLADAMQGLGPKLQEMFEKGMMEVTGVAKVVREADAFAEGLKNFRGKGEGSGDYPADLVTGLHHEGPEKRREHSHAIAKEWGIEPYPDQSIDDGLPHSKRGLSHSFIQTGQALASETKPEGSNNEGRKTVSHHSVNDIVSAGERLADAIQGLGPKLQEMFEKGVMEATGVAKVVREADAFAEGLKNFRGKGEGSGDYPADLVTGLHHEGPEKRREHSHAIAKEWGIEPYPDQSIDDGLPHSKRGLSHS